MLTLGLRPPRPARCPLPFELTGTNRRGRREPREYRELHIDWGDGSRPRTRTTVRSASATVGHTYAARGAYTVTGHRLRRPHHRQRGSTGLPSTIGNSAPTLTLVPASKTPSSWADLQPGTPITISGTASDPDTVGPLKVRVTWNHDPDSPEEIVVPRDPGQASGQFHAAAHRREGDQRKRRPPSLRPGAGGDGGGHRQATAPPAPRTCWRARVPDLQVVFSNLGWTAGTDTTTTSVIGKIRDPNGRRDFVQL